VENIWHDSESTHQGKDALGKRNAVSTNAIQRRTRTSAIPAAASTSKPAAKPATKPAAKPDLAPQPKTKLPAAPTRTSSTSTGTSTLKRSDSNLGAKKSQSAGDLFKSFAKSKPKAKEADASQESTPAPAEDGTYHPHNLLSVTNVSRTNARHVRRRRGRRRRARSQSRRRKARSGAPGS
jgi:hypothetical protein